MRIGRPPPQGVSFEARGWGTIRHEEGKGDAFWRYHARKLIFVRLSCGLQGRTGRNDQVDTLPENRRNITLYHKGVIEVLVLHWGRCGQRSCRFGCQYGITKWPRCK